MTQIQQLTVPVSERDHLQGSEQAAITLVQYGDYECPYTRRSNASVKALQEHFGERLRFAFRNFPLVSIHQHALHAAIAAEAAAAQGKFWEMHDKLFASQEALEDADLTRLAEALDLDMERFGREMAKRAYATRILEDVESGEQSGVEGTPTFFINGARHTGSWDYETLLAAIEQVHEA